MRWYIMDLKKNKKIILSAIIAFIVLVILLFINKPKYHDFIILEDRLGDFVELSIRDINRFKGIDIEELKNIDLSEHEETVQMNIQTILRFYESYKETKKSNFKKLYYLDQILNMTQFRNYDYSSVIFESAEGAKIKIEPTLREDYLILLSLEQYSGRFSLRLILPDDRHSQRWLKNITKITLDRF